MAWVQAEYADELSVIVTWLAAFLPWSVSHTTDAPFGSEMWFLRLGLFEVQLRFPTRITGEIQIDVEGLLATMYSGHAVVGNLYVDVPPAAALFYDDGLELAYAAYALGSVVLAAALVVSLAMYFREARTRAVLPMEYHRLTGYVLGTLVVLFALSSVLLLDTSPVVGLPIPVGLLVLAPLAFALVRIDGCDASDASQSANDP